MKRMIILTGSPRKNGNTAKAAELVRQGAESQGAQVRVMDIARLSYAVNGCTACMGCQRTALYRCVIEDDASPLLASLPDYDIIAFATPVYFFGPSAQLKLFLDRMYSLFKFNTDNGKITHRLQQKTIALIATAGGAQFAPLSDMFQSLADFSGTALKQLLLPHTQFQDDLAKDAAVRDKALSFGRGLAAT